MWDRVVRRVQVYDHITGDRRNQVGLVPDVIRAAREVQGGAHFPGSCHCVVEPELNAVLGYAWQSVARLDLDISLCVPKRIRW